MSFRVSRLPSPRSDDSLYEALILVCIRSSACTSISETANSPISTGMKPNPSSSSSMPKVNRGTASMGSAPTVAKRSPMAPLSNPLIMDRPESTPTMVRAKTMRAVRSAGPNFSATAARFWATSTNIMMLIIPPTNEAKSAIFKALPAFPCWVMG